MRLSILLFALVCLGSGATGATLSWTGATSNVWDTTTVNWQNGFATNFNNGDNVIFNAPGVSGLTITIDEGSEVSVGNISFVTDGVEIAGTDTLNASGFVDIAAGVTATITATITSDLFLVGRGTLVLNSAFDPANTLDASGFTGTLIGSNGEVLIAPVPLPAGFALMLGGIGLLYGLRTRARMSAPYKS